MVYKALEKILRSEQAYYVQDAVQVCQLVHRDQPLQVVGADNVFHVLVERTCQEVLLSLGHDVSWNIERNARFDLFRDCFVICGPKIMMVSMP